jgi:hypothetical protein
MLKSEAKKIGNLLNEIVNDLSSKDEIVILNLGSQVQNFIDLHQPYIYNYVFRKLENNSKIKIVNIDLQDLPGVDVIMDLTKESDYIKISQYLPDIVIISNLLEHVSSVDSVLSNLAKYFKGDYQVIVSGPRVFPYHADPIDNLFRPSKKELKNIFLKYGFIRISHKYKYSLNIFFSTKNFKEALVDNLYSIKTLINSPKKLLDRNLTKRFLPIVIFIGVFKKLTTTIK